MLAIKRVQCLLRLLAAVLGIASKFGCLSKQTTSPSGDTLHKRVRHRSFKSIFRCAFAPNCFSVSDTARLYKVERRFTSFRCVEQGKRDSSLWHRRLDRIVLAESASPRLACIGR
jgi:hypothetical protein